MAHVCCRWWKNSESLYTVCMRTSKYSYHIDQNSVYVNKYICYSNDYENHLINSLNNTHIMNDPIHGRNNIIAHSRTATTCGFYSIWTLYLYGLHIAVYNKLKYILGVQHISNNQYDFELRKPRVFYWVSYYYTQIRSVAAIDRVFMKTFTFRHYRYVD